MGNNKIKTLIKEATMGIASSQYQLGLCFYKGEDVKEQDYYRAVYWFKKAADECTDALYYLGLCYKNGFGAKKIEQQL